MAHIRIVNGSIVVLPSSARPGNVVLSVQTTGAALGGGSGIYLTIEQAEWLTEATTQAIMGACARRRETQATDPPPIGADW